MIFAVNLSIVLHMKFLTIISANSQGIYDLYNQIAHILTFPCSTQYNYNNSNAIRVIKSM